MKRWLCVLAALVMLCASFTAQAEERKIEYTGGVVLRTLPKDNKAPGADYINVGYVECSMPYLLLGQTTTWQLGIEGGQAPYEIDMVLRLREFDATDAYYWYHDSIHLEDERSFTYVFEEAGAYFWEITVTDSQGQMLVFQTRPMETAEAKEESDKQTVAGKVNQIIAEEITPEMSEYQRALVLHDWLIYHANYDYTYTWYDPAGVLLYGTGVCDSYARAYQMLCTAAGLECIYVSGLGNGGAHGWNLVKVDGSWYHVDCTWDDPSTGGYERHDYFLLTDEEIGRDHDWNFTDRGDMIVPESKDESLEDTQASDCDFTFTSMAEYVSALRAMMAAGDYRQQIVALYTGSQNINDVYDMFAQWACSELGAVLNGKGWWTEWSASGNRFLLSVDWNNPVEYIRFNEEKVILSIGQTQLIIPADYYPDENAFTWVSSDPSVATVSAAYSAEEGLMAALTGVSGGTAEITVTSRDGQSDSIEVVVKPAYTPEFNLAVEPEDGEVHLVWQSIPGVTEYHVMRSYNGSEDCLTVVTEHEATLTSKQLPSNVKQEVWIVGLRIVSGEVAAEYCGERMTYGEDSQPAAHIPVVDAAVAATCTQSGLTAGSHCEKCGEVITAQEVVPALGHDETVLPGVPATHVTTGLTEGVRCERCSEVLRAQEEIPVVQVAVFAVPESVQSIEAEAFAGCRFACVVVNQGCQRIGASAFADNAALRFAEIPASVKAIDATAFEGCGEELIIVTTAGSAAEAFARDNGIACVIR